DEADNCTATPLVAFVSDVSDGNNCPEVITRTYSVTDDCGNSINVTQTITVDDVTPPTASNPPTLNITTGPAPAPDVTAITDEADNCTLIPIVAFVSDSSDNNSCPETIYREYSITDDCGNQTFVTQLIIIGGGIVPSPVLTVNGPICEGDDATFTITGQADAVVTYDVGSGVQTTTLTGGISTIIITSSNTNLVMTLTNISDGSCSTVLNIVDSVVVNPVITPTFIQLGPYCVTGNVDVLPLVSNEGVTGTWSPDPIDNSLAGTFTTVFTPTLSQCTNTAQMDITITPAPFIEAAATDSLICEGDSIVLYISDISAGMLVDTFTMTFGSAFSYTTNNTVLPGPYVVVVNGTFTGATGEIRDAHYLFQQGGVPITPIAGSPWQWNGTNVSSQSVLPWSYNPIHEYNFFFNGGGSQTFSFTDSNYGDNSGSLTFEIYYLGNISWSTGSTDFTDTIYPPVGSNTYSVTVDYGSGCVATDDVTITVDPGTPATFAQLGPYCVTGNVDALPLVSNEGYTGTWSPNPIDNSSAGTFTTVFTPDPGQCAANDTMDITITPAPFIEAAATDSLICEGDSTVLYISDISAGMLVDTFTMTFGSAFSYTTNNTVLPGPYVVVVNGTFTGATGEIRDAHYLFQQGGVPITPIAGSPWQWNGTNVSSQSVLPWSYNPIHEYNFFFNGGGSQTFSFTDSNYGDNSGSLTFEIYYLGNISWSTGSTDFADTIYPPVGSNTYSVTVDYGSGCVATDDVIITVDPIITPTFTQLGPYCENNTSVVFLPSISNEGITGSWTPPIVDMAAVGQTTHLFSCDTLQCS
ncbi:hypothetical protein N8203_04685, partial [Crocinitomicaceae bacterium]|nr:hypothetical protein [Crocinitomicaceae bacterium]